MTQIEELRSLLQQVELTTVPDRDLDVAVGLLWPDPRPFSDSVLQQRGGKPPCYRFTGSIDAATGFTEKMLPGALISMRTQGLWNNQTLGNHAAVLVDGEDIGASASSVPLSVIAATLKALIARKEAA